MSADQRIFVHRIDADNRVASVNDEWEAFARENDATQLTRQNVIGTPLREFVFGLETWHLYELIFNRVRSDSNGITIPFRCDSPHRRRFME